MNVRIEHVKAEDLKPRHIGKKAEVIKTTLVGPVTVTGIVSDFEITAVHVTLYMGKTVFVARDGTVSFGSVDDLLEEK